MDSDERRFSGKVYSRRNRIPLKKNVSPATSAGVTEPETKVTFPVDSDERRFSGKVYSRRNRKSSLKEGVSLATAAGETTLETKVSETLEAEQPAKVIPQADLLITDSTSGFVPEGGVELGEGSRPDRSLISRAEDRVRVRLNKSRSPVAIGEARRVFEGELDEVRGMVTRVEAKEKLQHTSGKHRGLVLKTTRPISSYRIPRFTADFALKNRCPNLAGRVDVPKHPFRPPSLASIANNGIVEREKRDRKPNRYYYSSEYLLENDKLPFEIYKKSMKKNQKEAKNKGFAAGLKQGTSGGTRSSSIHVEDVRVANNGNSDSGSSSSG
ncbi:transcription factor GTE4-like isoform X1 [Solanum lycopersicum]|uniref:Uncharacterized protein n=1 Tax=Solanum lycopersicum TaxID=4081 RepID=A0A3Q7IAK7_SOLLC|nr:uncharacterized protein LOC104649478 [Solanum lycopersicum]XP_025883579.1 uncharacterized protein LOC104649478 [Solanum lycopersicum]